MLKVLQLDGSLTKKQRIAAGAATQSMNQTLDGFHNGACPTHARSQA